MISTLLSLLGGSLGAFLAKMVGDIFDFFKQKQKNKHDVDMLKLGHVQEMELRQFSLKETKEVKQIEFEQADLEYSFKEAIVAQKDASAPIGKNASIADKINKLMRPTFAYTFLLFFLIAKTTIIYAFIVNGQFDVDSVISFGSELWDTDTQTVFFTIVGFIYTARHFTNAQKYVSKK